MGGGSRNRSLGLKVKWVGLHKISEMGRFTLQNYLMFIGLFKAIT